MGAEVDPVQRRAGLTKQMPELLVDGLKIVAREESPRDPRLIRDQDQSGTGQFQSCKRLRHPRKQFKLIRGLVMKVLRALRVFVVHGFCGFNWRAGCALR